LKLDSRAVYRAESAKRIFAGHAAILLLIDSIWVTLSEENLVLYPNDEQRVQGALAIAARYNISA
jgi:hypothetical protein